VIQILCLLFPGLLAAMLYARLRKAPLKSATFAGASLVFVFLINFACFAVLVFMHHNELILSDDTAPLPFVLKYMALSSILALVLPVGLWYLRQNLHVSFHVIDRKAQK